MENKHDLPEGYLTKNFKYDMDLLRKLNEEYRDKPYKSTFTQYDDESQLKQAMSRLRKLENICDIKNKKVLEVGCGGGYVSHCLAKHYDCDVTGIDIYESEHWDDLKEDSLEFQKIDLSVENPFKQESFDLIISYVAWEHMRHPFKVLQECVNVLKLEGKLFICANLYRSPIASHLYRHIFFPWPHLLFDDEIVIEFALSQGVERWWIDAFYYVNKLTYSEYKAYFNFLNLKILDERLNYAKFDKAFYDRFEDKLGLYPIYDLEIDFFNVLLEKEKNTNMFRRLYIDMVRIKAEKLSFDDGIAIYAQCVTKEQNVRYAFYLYKDENAIIKIPYSDKNTVQFQVFENASYKVKDFIKDKNGNKNSKLSEILHIR